MDNQDYKRMLIRRAYKFSLEIMKFIDTFPQKDFSIQIISRQIIRSATSIGRYWLGLLRDSGKANKETSSRLLKEATELSNLLGSSILSLKGKK